MQIMNENLIFMCTYIYKLTEELRLHIIKIISGENKVLAPVVTLPIAVLTDARLMPQPPVPSESQVTRYVYDQIK